MMRAIVAMVIALVGLACGGATTSTENPGADGGGADGGGDAAGADYTMIDGAKCCAEGTGRQCCASDEPWWRCSQYGGPVGRCSGAGEPYATKVACAQCCARLRPIGLSDVAADGTCTVRPTDSRICAPCGDGVCDPSAGENRCSCPADCPNR